MLLQSTPSMFPFISLLLLLVVTSHTNIAVSAKTADATAIANLVQQLSAADAATTTTATQWRQLGKLLLDAGEYAEARRVFCHGSSCHPENDGLKHHVKVFEAFHGSSVTTRDEDGCSDTDNCPPVLEPLEPETIDDLFLSLEVPSSAIPDAVLKYPHSAVHLPAQRTRLVHASTQPIFPQPWCQYLMQQAAAAADKQGWTTDRHVQAPTCDIPVFDLPARTVRHVRATFEQVLFPLLCRVVAPALVIAPSDLRVQDCFIVRYDAENDDNPGFASLKPHQDESLLSLTIALNDDYQDGGLYISATQDVLDGPAGTVLCFCGGLVHGGYPVSRGTRWILTVFLYVDQNQSQKPPGYILEKLMSWKQSKTNVEPLRTFEQ